MPVYRKVLVPCTIERGGFGNERTYRVRLAGGEEHIGLAPWIYCLDNKHKPIEDEPAIKEIIKGFIVGNRIRNGGKEAKVAFPDGAVCLIDAKDAKEVPEETACVPVEP
jgi:hypothetical protein